MILQALHDYYARKPELPRDGFELKEIPFVIELEKDGRIVQIIDTREAQGRKKLARGFLVPQGAKKSVNISANLLWGNAEYVLALPDIKKLAEQQKKGKEKEYRARLTEMRDAFIAEIQSLPAATLGDDGIIAVNQFLQHFDANSVEQWGEVGKEVVASNPNLTFRLRGDVDLVCQRPRVANAIAGHETARGEALCLVTGKYDEVERLHSSVPSGDNGVDGAKSTGASVVSFNLAAFGSYGKDQGWNAPVGKRAAFAYTTALKHLLRRGSPQKLQVGDATTVFWADSESSLENDFAAFFDEPRKADADPDRGTRAIVALLQSARQGVGPVLDDKTRFFVLGLAPNAARVAIRFWHVGTVAEMADRIVRHFCDLGIDRHPEAKPFLSIKALLTATAAQGDNDNIPPNLGGEVMRSILQGLPYPETLFSGAVRRIRAEQSARDKRSGKVLMNVTHARAAILKACLNRKHQANEKEITVSLDKDNTNPGYRLGRLFAVLEQVQKEASGDVNATIRDRYYGAFSATPASVYPIVMRMSKHHLSKLGKDNPGRRTNLDNLIGEITMELSASGPPAHLSLQDQGRFAIGYYHQRMDSGTYRNTNNSKENDND